MDRIIEVKVGGNYIRKDKKTAGVRGEYEVAILRIEFDESWDEYQKSITFLDATGLNPVYKELDETRLENYTPNGRVYLVRIPKEPMAVAGDMTFVIDGIADGKKQRSMSDKLEVKDAPMPDDAKEPAKPTPNDVEQMRLELGRIKGSISDVLNMTVTSDTLEPWQEASVVKTLYENAPPSLWFGIPKGNTGDSGVYIGDEAPSDPVKNVWINPSASKLILMIRNEQGKWVEIPAITGKSAYEIALKYGFEGSEKEWIDKVEAEARMAEEARVVADLSASNALQSAQNAALSEEATYTQSNRAYNQAERAMEYALASGESSSSSLAFSEQARVYAGASGESATTSKGWADESFRNSQQAMGYSLASDESATSSHAFAEEAEKSAKRAEQAASQVAPAYGYVDMRGGYINWKPENVVDENGNFIGVRYGQVVKVNNAIITPNSKVDLQLTSEQMVVFYEKSLAFVAENNNGVVTIYCIGSIPKNDYTIQAIVTEVTVNE